MRHAESRPSFRSLFIRDPGGKKAVQKSVPGKKKEKKREKKKEKRPAGKVETCLKSRQLPTFPQALLRVVLSVEDWNQNLQYTLSKAGDISI